MSNTSPKTFHYKDYADIDYKSNHVVVLDHLNGFDADLNNDILARLDQHAQRVGTHYVFDERIKNKYPNLDFYHVEYFPTIKFMEDRHVATDKRFKNFLCSFNGTDSVARQFLTSALYKQALFKAAYCSKNFVYDEDRLDGNIQQYCSDDLERYIRKFFVGNPEFYQQTYSFDYKPYAHSANIDILLDKINGSFVQLVTETIGESYYPWLTEKIIYPIVTKSLWVAYAQPGYYKFLEAECGFKPYSKIFDYSFDQQTNPVLRVLELLDTISKFKHLSIPDWHDLYLLEQDTIEHNYDQYYSKRYRP